MPPITYLPRSRWLAWLPLLLAGCSDGTPTPAPASTPHLDVAALRDPQQCAQCHPAHFAQWSSSMHAYAAEDPIFRAMNARAQRETNGAIGDLCIRCHAPTAVSDGLTRDGLNLDQVPAWARGVTCFSCHSVDSVGTFSNNGLHHADDGALRGGIANPVAGTPHGALFSPLHARDSIASSSLCGSCHDIHLGDQLSPALTFSEWQGSLFGRDIDGQRLTCGNCHMPGERGPASTVDGSPVRDLHDHSMPGVDVALTDFPGREQQRALVQSNLDPSLVARLCVKPPHGDANVEVTLDNAFVGHNFPSGATYDRRAWVEVVAYEQGKVVYQSGVFPKNTSVDPAADPDLWLLRQKLLDASDSDVHFLWQAKKSVSTLLPPAVTRDPADPNFYHSVTRGYFVPITADRVTTRVLITPFPFEVIDDLIASGDLDPAIREQIPTFTLGGTVLEWTQSKGFGCVP